MGTCFRGEERTGEERRGEERRELKKENKDKEDEGFFAKPLREKSPRLHV